MSRRVGSASAENTRESGSAATVVLLVLNLSVEEEVRPSARVVNRSVEESLGRVRGADRAARARRQRRAARRQPAARRAARAATSARSASVSTVGRGAVARRPAGRPPRRRARAARRRTRPGGRAGPPGSPTGSNTRSRVSTCTRSARRPTSSCPRSGRPMASAAAPVASQNASAAVSAVAERPASRASCGGQPQVGEQVQPVVGRRPVGAHAHPDAAVEHGPQRRDPAGQLRVAGRAVGDGDVVLPPQLQVGVVQVHAVRGQHPPAEDVVRGEQRRHRQPVRRRAGRRPRSRSRRRAGAAAARAPGPRAAASRSTGSGTV